MVKYSKTVVFEGGLDLVTKPVEMPPGSAIAALNYEPDDQGYTRCEGYERYDGHSAPSQASYWVVPFDAGETAITSGQTLTGALSGATAVTLADAQVTSGDWSTNDAAGYVAVQEITGSFLDDEAIQVSASNVAVVDGSTVELGAETDALNETYRQAAIEARRAMIAAVPGSGSVLGVFSYAGDIWAVRNNAGGTAAVLHKATSTGWVAQSFGDELSFASGNVASFQEGETVTGGTSGATATIERVVLLSGFWTGSAAGYLVLSGVSGSFQNGEVLTGSVSGATASASGTGSSISLPAGGKYRFRAHNFYGSSNLRRVYGVNGEGWAFEWDGTVLAPIRTGLNAALEKPKHIGVQSNHLLLGYNGGHIQLSGPGRPLSFITTDGAAEFSVGQDITAIKSATKKSTLITCRNKISFLTGSDVNNFDLSDISEDSGAMSDTLVVVDQPYFVDDAGIRALSTAEAFGDWDIGTISKKVRPWFKGKRLASVAPIDAIRVRQKNQMRVFYADRGGMCMYFGRSMPEAMPFELGFTPTCVISTEDASGNEVIFAGADDGFVYQLDSGNSFDGAQVSAYCRTAFMNQGRPDQEKRYHRAKLKTVGGGPGTTINVSKDFSYGDPDSPASTEQNLDLKGGGGFWDAAYWDQFYWDTRVQSEAWTDLDGVGDSVSLVFMSDATYEPPATLSSLTVQYSLRKMVR